MAEHLNQPPHQPLDPMANMGKPIPWRRRAEGYAHVKEMGVTDPDMGMACVDGVANKLERDQPYEAQAMGMRYLDLTGTYRLFAVLLTPIPEEALHS